MSLDVRGGFDVLVSDGYELEGEVNQIMLSNCMSFREWNMVFGIQTVRTRVMNPTSMTSK